SSLSMTETLDAPAGVSAPARSGWRRIPADIWVATAIIAMFAMLHNPFWSAGGDSEVYLDMARNLAMGKGYLFNHQPVSQVTPLRKTHDRLHRDAGGDAGDIFRTASRVARPPGSDRSALRRAARQSLRLHQRRAHVFGLRRSDQRRVAMDRRSGLATGVDRKQAHQARGVRRGVDRAAGDAGVCAVAR